MATHPISDPPAPALPHLSVVAPVYGCAPCLEDLVERIERATSNICNSLEVILVDDASPDQAWPRIQELAQRYPWVKGIRLTRNFGQHNAIAAGIEQTTGDLIAVLDCDLQDPPEELSKLIDAMPGYDIVFALRENRQDSLLKRSSSLIFAKTLEYLTGVEQDQRIANFGVFSRRAIDTINAMPEHDRFFPLMVRWTGLPMTTVPVTHAARSVGSSGYSFKKLLNLATNIVLSYSDKPLRLVIRLGLYFSATALLIVALSIYRYSNGDIAVAGFTSIIASIWLIGGTIIFCLGIIGLYLGRLFTAAKQRPHYIIREHTKSAKMQAHQ